jgi:membrane dipeptidase
LALLLLPEVNAAPSKPGLVDLHVDLSYQVNFKNQPVRSGSGQYDVRWLKQAGVEGVVLPLYIPRDASSAGPQLQHLEQSHHEMVRLLPQTDAYRIGICGPPNGVTGVQFGFEGAEPLGWNLNSLPSWRSRGVRLYGLVHAYDTSVASSSGHGFSARGYGLTARGRELVRRIHRLGGMVDISHASDEAVQEVLAQARAAGVPVVATHSNTRRLARDPRNLTDAQLRAVAKTGGIVGINFHSPYLLGGRGQAQISDVVRHIRHAVSVMGAAHVAIGSDFEGGIRPARGLEDIRGLPRLAQALRDAGLAEADVRAIFGGNAKRLLCGGS